MFGGLGLRVKGLGCTFRVEHVRLSGLRVLYKGEIGIREVV